MYWVLITTSIVLVHYSLGRGLSSTDKTVSKIYYSLPLLIYIMYSTIFLFFSSNTVTGINSSFKKMVINRALNFTLVLLSSLIIMSFFLISYKGQPDFLIKGVLHTSFLVIGFSAAFLAIEFAFIMGLRHTYRRAQKKQESITRMLIDQSLSYSDIQNLIYEKRFTNGVFYSFSSTNGSLNSNQLNHINRLIHEYFKNNFAFYYSSDIYNIYIDFSESNSKSYIEFTDYVEELFNEFMVQSKLDLNISWVNYNYESHNLKDTIESLNRYDFQEKNTVNKVSLLNNYFHDFISDEDIEKYNVTSSRNKKNIYHIKYYDGKENLNLQKSIINFSSEAKLDFLSFINKKMLSKINDNNKLIIELNKDFFSSRSFDLNLFKEKCNPQKTLIGINYYELHLFSRELIEELSKYYELTLINASDLKYNDEVFSSISHNFKYYFDYDNQNYKYNLFKKDAPQKNYANLITI